MTIKSDDVLKLSLAAAALAGGLGAGYHYGVYLPAKDRAEEARRALAELEKQNRAAEIKAAEAKQIEARNATYRICLSNAQADYTSRWNSTCRDNARAASNRRLTCIQNGVDPDWCNTQYPLQQETECQLSSTVAASYDAALKEERRQCLDEAKADVARFSE